MAYTNVGGKDGPHGRGAEKRQDILGSGLSISIAPPLLICSYILSLGKFYGKASRGGGQ